MARMPSKSMIRRWVEDLAVGKRVKIWMLCDVSRVWGVYLVPSESELGSYYTVVEFAQGTGKRTTNRFVCQCKGFRFSEKDKCKHVTGIKDTPQSVRWALPKLFR